MRDRMDVVVCDAGGCGAKVVGPASRLADRARAAGWQVAAVTAAWATDDGPDLTREDRCPEHPAPTVSDDVLLRELGGPGGLTPGELAGDPRAWDR